MRTSLVVACIGLTSLLQAQKLPEGKGKEVVEAACDGCHGVDQIIGRAWSADKWRSVVKSMIDKGAVLSDDELKAVIDYLAANFGEAPAKAK
jgi:cytochrome c5